MHFFCTERGFLKEIFLEIERRAELFLLPSNSVACKLQIRTRKIGRNIAAHFSGSFSSSSLLENKYRAKQPPPWPTALRQPNWFFSLTNCIVLFENSDFAPCLWSSALRRRPSGPSPSPCDDFSSGRAGAQRYRKVVSQKKDYHRPGRSVSSTSSTPWPTWTASGYTVQYTPGNLPCKSFAFPNISA